MEEPTNTDQQHPLALPKLTEGVQCPKCPRIFSNVVGLRMHNIRKHTDRNWDTGGNFKGRKKGKKWTPEHRANFIRAMKKVKARRERIQIVYPDPRDAMEQEAEQQPTNIRRVRFCPFCGEQIEKHLYETP